MRVFVLRARARLEFKGFPFPNNRCCEWVGYIIKIMFFEIMFFEYEQVYKSQNASIAAMQRLQIIFAETQILCSITRNKEGHELIDYTSISSRFIFRHKVATWIPRSFAVCDRWYRFLSRASIISRRSKASHDCPMDVDWFVEVGRERYSGKCVFSIASP